MTQLTQSLDASLRLKSLSGNSSAFGVTFRRPLRRLHTQLPGNTARCRGYSAKLCVLCYREFSDQTFGLPCGFIKRFCETWGVEKLQTACKPLSTVNEFKIPRVVVFERFEKVSLYERDTIFMSNHRILFSCLLANAETA